MLRITTNDNPPVLTFRLEGRLEGAWVRELEQCWRGVLDSESAQSVVRVVTEKLLTPMGLRTLPTDAPEFHGVYDGDAKQRDEALHQGTVWAWMLGPYISALVKANGAAARVEAAKLLKPFTNKSYARLLDRGTTDHKTRDRNEAES